MNICKEVKVKEANGKVESYVRGTAKLTPDLLRELAASPMTRKLREQRMTELGKVLETESKGQPSGAFGEYLGDIQTFRWTMRS
jgi:hypothetical protein